MSTSKFKELWSPARQQLWPWRRSKVMACHHLKGLVTRIMHAKCQCSIINTSEDVSQVKVFVTDRRTDRGTDGWMRFNVPTLSRKRGTINNANNLQFQTAHSGSNFPKLHFWWDFPVQGTRTRGPKDHISASEYNVPPFLTDRPGRPFLFIHHPEKHKLGTEHLNLASSHVSLNSVQWFQRRSGKCLSQWEARAAFYFLALLVKNLNS